MAINKYFQWEKKFAFLLKRWSVPLIRYALGTIYFWYGALKVIGISPAEELVFRATHWIGVHDFVIFLGVWEMIIGLCFFFKKFLRVGLILFFIHFPGAFLPLFINPEDCFTIIPYGLTLEGQYIFKNLLSLAAAFVLVGSLHFNGNNQFLEEKK